jgi:hypothetical protein
VHGGNPAHDCLILVLELDQQKLPMHRRALKVISIRENDIGVELEPSLAKAAKDAHDFVFGEQDQFRRFRS